MAPRHCSFWSCRRGPFTAHLHPTLWHLGLRPDALSFPHSHRTITYSLGLWAPSSQGSNLSRSPLQLPVARSSEVSQHQGLAHPAPPRPLPTLHGPLLACVQPASFFRAGLSVIHVGSTAHPCQAPASSLVGEMGLGPPEGSSSLQTGVCPPGAESRDPSLPRAAGWLTSHVQPRAPGPPPDQHPAPPTASPATSAPTHHTHRHVYPGTSAPTPGHVPSDLSPDPPCPSPRPQRPRPRPPRRGGRGEPPSARMPRRQCCVCRPRTDETRWHWVPGGGAQTALHLS